MLKLKLRWLKFTVLIFTFLFLGFSSFGTISVRAECPATDYQCQIDELQREYEARKDAHEKNKAELANYRKQLASIQKRLADLDSQLKKTEAEILTREIDLGVQEELLSARIREMYKRNREFTLLTLLLSSKSLTDFSQGLALRGITAKQDWQIITATSERILSLKNDKETLKKNQASAAALKSQVDKQVDFLAGEVEKTESFFARIKARQAELSALKAGGFATSVGDVPPADDPASRPDYNPGFSPAFAAFSFGAPHRKGMSQYGAYGRAKSGQSAEEILKAYYGGGIEIKKDYSTSINIRVQGYGTVDIETYVKRIYEMPGSWGDSGGFEALKAQAVAARSYALAYTNNGAGSICATESCQVYKPANKGGKWDEAVNATRGWVLIAGGKPFSAWYASTAGGYTFSYSHNGHSTPGLWDTPNGRNGWTSEAYEKTAGSPWFYKAWYRTRSGDSYGRSHPWLNEEEFCDILNAILIYKNDSGAKTHLSPIDANIPETWSMSQVREEAAKRGGPITSVSSLEVIYSNDGYTAKVIFQTNKSKQEFTGEEFKAIFNLRTPGAIGIKSSLFNLMRK
ncbi:MAG TPA: SpoIID/LytB domain-containing protein [Patescibacteria group bacterium]|nr:SpoIID/LytB domain-containing protein [Patescibacteria group bacterium]